MHIFCCGYHCALSDYYPSNVTKAGRINHSTIQGRGEGVPWNCRGSVPPMMVARWKEPDIIAPGWKANRGANITRIEKRQSDNSQINSQSVVLLDQSNLLITWRLFDHAVATAEEKTWWLFYNSSGQQGDYGHLSTPTISQLNLFPRNLLFGFDSFATWTVIEFQASTQSDMPTQRSW